ncbi:hypothetical protein B0A50_08693 [Salinomyces thailandicus]|uniref:U three protein 23 n=1 Tax=Salinomyces thailandicus TaxID=706561 RepID=A0A4U0TIX8_9PEZI|nr:hypothetical protein B0A50_08693 [Salinomyces thailandica]
MRGKRSKQYRKLMHQYALAFGHREPYQVLLDAGIIRAAANFKMRLGAMLANTLHGEIKPLISQCCIRHLYDYETATPEQEREKQEWISVAKQAERRRCGHHELEKPLGAMECVMSMVDPKGSGGNKHRYVVATQDEGLRRALRGVVGVPVVYVKRSVMVLEPMGAVTARVKEGGEKGKLRAGLTSLRPAGTGMKRKREDEEEGEGENGKRIKPETPQPVQPKLRKAKGPKGPNPLSAKKKSKTLPSSQDKPDDNKLSTRKPATKPHLSPSSPTADTATAIPAETTAEDENQRKRKRRRRPREGNSEETQEGAEAVAVAGAVAV